MSETGFVARAWALRARLIRFAGVSVIGVVVTQTLLILLKGGLGWAGVPANIVATAVAAVPAYLLNRRWVWGVRGAHSFSREIVPFWSYTLLGLALSTGFVAYADSRWGSTVAVSIANLVGWAVLWCGKFVLLERYLFGEDDEELMSTASR